MRKLIVIGLLLSATSSMMAQQKVKSLSMELFGAQNTIGINYDCRLKGNSGLGYRIGVGFGYGDNTSLFDQNIKGVGVPVELNYLLGNKHHKLEIGLGTSLGIYHVKETSWQYYQPVPPETEGHDEQTTSSSNQFGYFLFGDIGYRYQRNNGLMFRVGISPSFNFGDKYGQKKSVFYVTIRNQPSCI